MKLPKHIFKVTGALAVASFLYGAYNWMNIDQTYLKAYHNQEEKVINIERRVDTTSNLERAIDSLEVLESLKDKELEENQSKRDNSTFMLYGLAWLP